MSIFDLLKKNKPTPNNYADLVNEGVRMVSGGDIQKAINNYKEAINLDPTREEAYANLANAYDDLNDYENAITIYEKCIEINPTNPNNYFNLGIIYNNFRNKSALNIFDLDQPIGQVSENEENSNVCFLMAAYLGDEEARRVLETREIVFSSNGDIERKKPNLSTKEGIIKDLILLAQYKMEWGFHSSAKKIFTYVLSIDKSNKTAIIGVTSCNNYDEEMETPSRKTNNSFKKFLNDLNNFSLKRKYRCDVYKDNGQKLINNVKGFLRIQKDKVTLETDDGSGDMIIFYPEEDKLLCKYIVMSGRIMADESFKNIEFQLVEFPSNKLNIEVQHNTGEWLENPVINKSELIIPFDKIVYVSSKYSLFKSDSLYRTSSHISHLTLIESPLIENIYLVYNDCALEGIPAELIKMKIIRQSKDQIELIGIEQNLEISYSDYGITLKFSGQNINQVVFHNFEKEFDYVFEGTTSNKTNYDKAKLKKDFPVQLEQAVRSFKLDKYKTLLEYLLAKYPNFYKIHYIIGILVRKIYYFDEAIRLNKKYADAYDYKLNLLIGEGVEKERYDTLKLLIKYKRHLSSLNKFFFPIRYLELAELEKQFGNNQQAWKYLSKYFSADSNHISDAFYLRASLYLEKKKYNNALTDINECLNQQENQNYYLLRAKINEALGDIEGSENDKKEAKNIEENQSDENNQSDEIVLF